VPIQVTCPSCQGMFNAPDSAGGKRAKCPTCGGAIQIPAHAVAEVLADGPAPANAYAGDDFSIPAPAGGVAGEDRKQCPMCGEIIAAKAIKCRFCNEILDPSMKGMIGATSDASDPGWLRVRSGLATLYYCIVIIFITAILMGIGAVAAFAIAGNAGGDSPVLALIFLVLGVVVIIGAGIGSFVGQVFCISVPENSGARAFIIGSIVCTVANVFLSMVGGAADSQAISGLGSLVSLVGSVLFILFIRQAATYLGDHQLATSAFRFILFGIAVVVGAVALGVMAGIAGAPALIAVLGLAVIVCAIVYLVWYLKLIRSLMATIDHRVGAR
jgi:hypothetical protein